MSWTYASKMSGFLLRASCVIAAALSSPLAFAANDSAQTFTLDGQLFQVGTTTPLNDANAKIVIQVLDRSKTCVLYEETQHVNTSTSLGYFNIQVGSATGSSKRSSGDSGHAMALVFQNRFPISGINAGTSTTCVGGTYTPTAGDQRFFRMIVTPTATNVADVMLPDISLDSVPSALVAQSIQGVERDGILQVNNTSPSVLNQSNLESIFSNISFPKLNALLSGSSSQYMPSSPSSTVDFNNQRVTNVATPTAATDVTNKTYVDSNVGGKTVDVTGVGLGAGGGKTLVWDQALNKWVAQTVSASMTGIVSGPGLLGGTITSYGTLSVDVGTTGNKIVQLTNGVLPAVDGSLLTNVQFPVTSVAGRTGAVTLNAADIAGLGAAATKNYGTASGNLVELSSASQLPALDGWLLSNINASFLQLRAVSTTAPTAGQILAWNNTALKWEPQNAPINAVTALTGDVAATGPGSTTATIGNDKVTSAKINSVGFAVNRLLITDAITGGTVTYATCANNEVMKYSTVTGWGCATDVEASGLVTAVAAGTGLTGGTITNYGTLNVDVGTIGNKIVQLTAGAQYPAVDGNLISNVSAVKLQARNVSSAIPTADQVLRWNNTSSVWEPSNSTTGSVTQIVTSTGLLGGTIISAGTISVDVGTGSNQILQLTAGSQYPAVDGNLIANVNAVKLQARDVASTAPAPGQVLGWNSGSSKWEPISAAVGSVTGVVSGVGLVAGTISSYGTLNVDIGTSANQIMRLTAAAQIPAVDGFLVSNLNVTKIQNRAVSSTTPSASQVLTWNGSQWEAQASQTATNVFVNGGNTFGGTTSLGTDDNYALNIKTNSASRLYLDQWGNVGFGTGAGVTYPITLEGSISKIIGVQRRPSNNVGVDLTVVAGGAKSGNTDRAGGDLILSSGIATGLASSNLQFRTSTPTASSTTDNTPTTKMYIDGTGSIGIGTITPKALLDVYGTGTGQSAMIVPRDSTALRPSAPINGMIRYNSSTSKFEGYENATWTNLMTGSGTAGDFMANGTVPMTGNLNVWKGSAALPGVSFADDTSSGMYDVGVGTLGFATAGTQRMVIDSSGNVGIGIASPQKALHVAGAGASSIIEVQDTASALPLNAQPAVTFNTSDGTRIGWMGDGSPTGDIMAMVADTGELRLNTTASQPIKFTTANTERMRIDSAGKVGIGTTSPQTILDVYGTGTARSALLLPRDTLANRPSGVNGMIRYNSSTNRLEGFESGQWGNISAATADTASQWTTSGSNIYYNLGNVGIGTTNPDKTLHVAGTTRLGGTTFIGPAGAGQGALTYSPDIGGGEPGVILQGDAGNGLLLRANASSATSLVVKISGNVGIGTTSPSRPLHISSTAADIANGGVLFVDGQMTSTAFNQYGIRFGGAVAPSAASNMAFYGVAGAITSGSANVSSAAFYGIGGNPSFNGTGTLGTMVGTSGIIQNTSTGTISSAMSLRAMPPTNTSGTITNMYGLYIDSQTVGTQTNPPFGIYQAGAFDKNYFAGNVGIGTTTPAAKLQIDSSSAATSGLVSGLKSTQLLTGASVTTAAIQGGYGLAGFANTTVSSASSAIGLDGYASNTSTGTLGTAIAIKGNVENQTTGSIDFASGGQFAVTRTAGTVSNARGVEIGTIQGTTKHSIYATDATAPSYFAGSVGIGTTTPGATLDVKGHIANSGTAATVGTCGTSPAISGNDTRGIVTLGTGSPTACTVTFNAAYTSSPHCVITPYGGNPGAIQWWITASTTTLIINFSAAPTASQQFEYQCMQ